MVLMTESECKGYAEGSPIHPSDMIAGINTEDIVLVLKAIKKEIARATTVPKECHHDAINYKMTEADLEFDKKQAYEMAEALIVFFEGYVPI